MSPRHTSYLLRPARPHDEPWLEALRREVYRELVIRTFGQWEEARHARHCAECLARGPISLVEVGGLPVGMLQLFEQPASIVVGEIQLQPRHQRLGLGSQILRDVLSRAHRDGRSVQLSVAHKNDGAHRLYRRLGFEELTRNASHIVLESRAPRRGP
jgi:ribosomal protein S18 acetylase RimI-like enzyme